MLAPSVAMAGILSCHKRMASKDDSTITISLNFTLFKLNKTLFLGSPVEFLKDFPSTERPTNPTQISV